MNQKKEISSFIKHVVDSNYAAADATLKSIVNEKLKKRIQQSDSTLSNKNTKKS